MKHIDLDIDHYTRRFKFSQVYIKNVKVYAEQLTEEGLSLGYYSDRDIHYNPRLDRYEVHTYVIREKLVNGKIIRRAELEHICPVFPGQWLITNPKTSPLDHINNYVINDIFFNERYKPTSEPGIYRACGLSRIIRNDTEDFVEITAPWGEPQYGDEYCFFCAPCNKNDATDLAVGRRYIISANDCKAYTLARTVLGQHWDK